MDVGRSGPRNALAVARMAGHVLTGPLLRRRRTTWGATAEEAQASWPGDELVPAPAWSATHAVTTRASAEQLWPWLAQLGQGRGGLYSFELLENLIGCRMHNADRVLPQHQELSAGDEIRLHPQAALTVVGVEPGRDLVLAAPTGPSTAAQRVPGGVWSFHLRPAPGGGTRLVERLRLAAAPTWQERLATSPALVEPISFVMTQEMLRNIVRLAEGDTASPSTRRTTMTRTGTSRSTTRKGSRGRRTRWEDLTAGQQTALLMLASVQVSLAATAWADLALRPAEEVNGGKGRWAAIIAINFVGPVLYFRYGIRR
ncbi:hypothetical protein [Kocuria turfanensis]|uniref:hypothetical protein n=1 Tax=Kocuria turfanensis TaxID=388357 RepID=UPI001E63F67F|nr:hypothetical protein [Kocuria turfanensis]